MEREDRTETVDQGIRTSREVSVMDRIEGKDRIGMTIEMTTEMIIVMTIEMIDSKVPETEDTETINRKVWCRGLKN